MHYEILSFSHKTAPMSVREKLSFLDANEKKSFLSILLAHKNIYEAILLNTCNRTEFILYIKNTEETNKFIFHELSFFCNMHKKELKSISVTHKDKKAVEHIFNVSSSLESIVVGETQITGQLKDAYKYAISNDFCSKNLGRLIHFASKCAKKVRRDTDISKDNTSIASVAINCLKKENVVLKNKTVLVVGVGDMSALALKYFTKKSYRVVLVNRTTQKANALKDEIGENIVVKRFEKLKDLINDAEVIFTATSAPSAIITKDMIKETSFHRYWFDMAMPKDIEEIDNKNIKVYNIDSLKQVIEESKDNRVQESKLARIIVKNLVEKFFEVDTQIESIPVIKELKQNAKTIFQEEVSYAIKNGYLAQEQELFAQKMLDRAFSKFLHHPIVNLKKIANSQTRESVGDAISYLFDKEPNKEPNVENL